VEIDILMEGEGFLVRVKPSYSKSYIDIVDIEGAAARSKCIAGF
jgi:hypothetical protein